MSNITTKQRLSLTIGAYFFVLLFLISLIFIGVFHYVFIGQIKSSVVTEASEIIRNHILISENQVVSSKDKSGIPLSEELLENNSSALILDNNLYFVEGYGIYEFYRSEDQATINSVIRLIRNTVKTRKTSQEIISWRANNMYMFSAPLIKNDQYYGTIVLARPLSQVEYADKVLFITLALIGTIGLLGSLGLGYRLADLVLKPIRDMSATIEKIDLDKLNREVYYSGHKSDELTILATKFNAMLVRLKLMSDQEREFISNVSHELRTPLARIISSIEVMSLKAGQQTKTTLEEITDNLFGINSLISDLLVLSKIRRSDLKRSSPVNLRKTLESVISDIESDTRKKGIKYEINIIGNLFVYLPSAYLQLLLTNLISNAIKYSHEGGVIFLQATTTRKQVHFMIRDEGVGIDHFEKEKIFDRFFRSDRTRSNTSGNGIGLAIVKRICDLYEIKVEVQSEKDRGSQFDLFFFNKD